MARIAREFHDHIVGGDSSGVMAGVAEWVWEYGAEASAYLYQIDIAASNLGYQLHIDSALRNDRVGEVVEKLKRDVDTDPQWVGSIKRDPRHTAERLMLLFYGSLIVLERKDLEGKIDQVVGEIADEWKYVVEALRIDPDAYFNYKVNMAMLSTQKPPW